MIEDPLKNPAFRPPGFGEKLRDALLGAGRPLDCLQIEVTSFCGAACIYCPHTTQACAWKSRHMSAETFARLWPALRQASRAHLQGWGEPLLHPRFFDFADLASRAGCQISTTTCGLNMNEEIARNIIASGMDLIAFSLVGTDAQSNSARARADFAKVCANIKFLRQAIRESGCETPPEIHIAYLLLADRMEAAAGLPELMDDLDVEMAVISTLDYLALPVQKSLAITPAETDKIARARGILEEAAARAGKSGRIIHFALPAEKDAGQESGCRENASRCMYVNSAGEISPCVYLNVNDSGIKTFGNVNELSPLDIWNKSEYKIFRKSLRGKDPDSVCRDCPKRMEMEIG